MKRSVVIKLLLTLMICLTFCIPQSIEVEAGLNRKFGNNTQNKSYSNTDKGELEERLALKNHLEGLLDEYYIAYFVYSNDEILLTCTHPKNVMPDDNVNYKFELLCINLSNKSIGWKHQLEDRVRGYAYHENRLVVLSDHSIICFDLIAGKTLWKNKLDFELIKPVMCTSEKAVFLAHSDKLIYFDLTDGEIKWERAIENLYLPNKSYHNAPDVAYSDNRLVYYRFGIFCINPENGEIVWKSAPYSDDTDRYKHLVCAFASDVLITGDIIIAIKQSKFGYVAFDINSGELLWENDESGCRTFTSNNDFVFTGYSVFNAKNGDIIWAFGGYKYNKHALIWASYITNDKLFITTSAENNSPDRLHMMNFYDGIEEWRYYLSKKHDTNYSFYDSYLLVNNSGRIFCFSPAADSLTFQINQNTYKPDNDDMTEMDSKPTILQDRTYLPARYVCEPLGGQVFWDASEKKVTCKLVAPDNAETEEYKENIVELWIGKPTAKVNGVEVQIDPNNLEVVPTIINDRTMVPMRFLAESLGCSVEWIAESKEIILTYSP